jgi:hypothetical protein
MVGSNSGRRRRVGVGESMEVGVEEDEMYYELNRTVDIKVQRLSGLCLIISDWYLSEACYCTNACD